MTTVRWLHLSDLHLRGDARDPYDRNKVLRPLLATVRERTERDGPPDLVFVTGDIASTGSRADYDVAAGFADELVACTGVAPERMWLVPGNHDVERRAGRWLRRTLDSAQDADNEFFGRENHNQREPYLNKLAAYRDFVRTFQPGCPLAEGDVVRRPEIVAVGGARVGVLPLNSAWFCQDDDDQGRLWLGTRTVRERGELLLQRDPHVVFVLLHHPFSWMHADETAHAWIRQVYPIILSGHLHTADVTGTQALSGTSLDISAGAAYQGSEWPNRVFYGSLDAGTRKVMLEPLTFADGPAAHRWVLDTKVFPHRASDGYVGEFTLPARPRATGKVAADQSLEFPFAVWSAVNRRRWLSSVVDWFHHAYSHDPDAAMSALLDHVFQIYAAAWRSPNIMASIVNLGTALGPHLPARLPPEQAHHRTVITLLEYGLHRNLSHLFMLPQIDRDALLEIPNYANLLLATRLLTAGIYQDASKLAAEIGDGCCIALYVMGQSFRKRELNHEAGDRFSRLSELIGEIRRHEPGFFPCNASGNEPPRCLCNLDLLHAETERARGVVARRLQQTELAERHFAAATDVASSVVEQQRQPRLGAPDQGSVHTSYDMAPFRVLADVHYGHGYYWYQRDMLDRAAELFNAAIDALDRAREDWDPPITRLAIVRLLQSDPKAAGKLALRARNICIRTAPASNREATLSLSLCTLVLKVLEAVLGHRILDPAIDPITDLGRALRLSPPLGSGPLNCHRTDAEKLLPVAPQRVQPLVAEFIRRIGDAETGLAS
ncbi:metallophosphoesterase [Nonomuraea sp. B10E15]|uniref:metallophosphoesterase family protein n=1 Tax=Nonomuraea sp. B10E15 TaxID=3153560 RepID=UPI00325E9BD6